MFQQMSFADFLPEMSGKPTNKFEDFESEVEE
jgi:hypothetical protein